MEGGGERVELYISRWYCREQQTFLEGALHWNILRWGRKKSTAVETQQFPCWLSPKVHKKIVGATPALHKQIAKTAKVKAACPNNATAAVCCSILPSNEQKQKQKLLSVCVVCSTLDRWLLSADKILTPTASTLSPHKLDLIRVSHAMN